jgi:hypothetical protein
MWSVCNYKKLVYKCSNKHCDFLLPKFDGWIFPKKEKDVIKFLQTLEPEEYVIPVADGDMIISICFDKTTKNIRLDFKNYVRKIRRRK